MGLLASRVVRRFKKSAAPRPWDLPTAISLEELAQGHPWLELKLGLSTHDIAAGGILDSATLTTLVRLRQPRSRPPAGSCGMMSIPTRRTCFAVWPPCRNVPSPGSRVRVKRSDVH